MRVSVFFLIAALASPAAMAMTAPEDIFWTCGIVQTAGAAGPDSGFRLIDAQAGKQDFHVGADGAGAPAMSQLVSNAAANGALVAVGHPFRGDDAKIVEVGGPGARCWQLEAAGRKSYARTYDERRAADAAAAAAAEPVRHAKIQRLKRWR